nr:fucolectin-like; partial [Biomphalaria glabrata]
MAIVNSIYVVLLAMVVAVAGLYNASRFKPALQSSNLVNYYAYLGVDGNYDGDMNNGHCQHTYSNYNPWWMVDLRGQFVIEKIQLTNRHDIYNGEDVSYRIRNFYIEVFQTDPRQLANFPNVIGQICYNQTNPLGPGTFNFTCDAPVTGRYVRYIMRNNISEVLQICEMEVLVSSSSFEEMLFNKLKNTQLTTPFDRTTVADRFRCLKRCQLRRSTDFCTSLNWITSTGSCQPLPGHSF